MLTEIIDDVEKPWLWASPFDFIFLRDFFVNLELVEKCFTSLEPGGYLELRGTSLAMEFNDGAKPPDTWLSIMCSIVTDAAKKQGCDIDSAREYEKMLENAGFEDVVVKRYKWPINWRQKNKEKAMEVLGKWSFTNMNLYLEALCLRLLKKAGWDENEIMVLCAKARQDLWETRFDAYWPV